MKTPRRQKSRTRRIQLALLIALVSVQALLSLGLVDVRPDIKRGFLIKSGNEYAVYWDENGKYWEQRFPDLSSALHFSRKSLALKEIGNRLAAENIERIWVQDRSGRYQLFWKTHHLPYLFRLTFDSQDEVKFFAKAFRNGSYSGSPFGHSLLLLPIEKSY